MQHIRSDQLAVSGEARHPGGPEVFGGVPNDSDHKIMSVRVACVWQDVSSVAAGTRLCYEHTHPSCTVAIRLVGSGQVLPECGVQDTTSRARLVTSYGPR